MITFATYVNFFPQVLRWVYIVQSYHLIVHRFSIACIKKKGIVTGDPYINRNTGGAILASVLDI